MMPVSMRDSSELCDARPARGSLRRCARVIRKAMPLVDPATIGCSGAPVRVLGHFRRRQIPARNAVAFGLTLAASLALASPAGAQRKPAEPPAASSDAEAQARTLFERGSALADEHRH